MRLSNKLGARSATKCLVILTLFACTIAYAQLPAPTAFSDYTGCTPYTCTWVPFIRNRVWARGVYTYTVKTASGTGGDFILRRGGSILLSAELKDLDAGVAVTWSKNNSNFAVTWSDGGAIGGFHVLVFRISRDKVRELPATRQAFANFRSRYYCETRGDNLQAYGWDSADRLVLVASVYPTSDCGADMGYTEGYIVQAGTGKILRRMTLKELRLYIRQHPR
jgi:hypothetical protein